VFETGEESRIRYADIRALRVGRQSEGKDAVSIAIDQKPRYTMQISRLTVDKLGVKLYDRVSAVLAELVANSYDADAGTVEIEAPMGEYLATKAGGTLEDKGFEIIVRDDGHGMTPQQVQDYYLKVGAERRRDPSRKTSPGGRRVMGRKGVGKLAPFGICQRIEVLSSGGEIIDGIDEDGRSTRVFLTAHLTLDRAGILDDTTAPYEPIPGAYDGIVRQVRGTTLTLSGFGFRQVPTLDKLDRQLAQRFGLHRIDWSIVLTDNGKDDDDEQRVRVVGRFEVPTNPDTVFRLGAGVVRAPNNVPLEVLRDGFEHDGRFYDVHGWIGYASNPYRDDLMAGVRIYCRGKIAAQTAVFNRKAGFTGEYDVRSYLVGEMHADWLDEEEDLIQTDRRDILWSHELGQAFESWGQAIVLAVGRGAKEPVKKKAWETFRDLSGIVERVNEAYSRADQMRIRENTLGIAKTIAQSMRGDPLNEADVREDVVQLSLLFGPHLTLDESLREAASGDSPLEVVSNILRIARVAELSSFGRIAENRVRVIERVEALREDPHQNEDAYQELISGAPWLIDPQWAPITANQTFSSLKHELEKFLSARLSESIELGVFSLGRKRADFVLHNHDTVLELIEIKKPSHRFTNEEMKRLNNYHRLMHEFLSDERNKHFKDAFPNYHLTLVCDDTDLDGSELSLYESLVTLGTLEPISWGVFLARTKQMHQDYLAEAENKRRNASVSS